MSHWYSMTNRLWVILLCFFARKSHQSCLIQPWPTESEWHCLTVSFECLIPWPTGCEWHCCIPLPYSLINHVSSHDQQGVSDTALFLCQTVSSIMFHPMANSKWVTLLYFFARQSHQSCLIPSPTGCELHCFSPLPGSLINHVSSHHKQLVSDIAWFLYEMVSSIISHPMTNRMWVTLLYSFARQSHLSCLIPSPTACKWPWHCFISLPDSFINHVSSHDQQDVSDTALFLCQPGSLINHVSSHDQQGVSDTALFLC